MDREISSDNTKKKKKKRKTKIVSNHTRENLNEKSNCLFYNSIPLKSTIHNQVALVSLSHITLTNPFPYPFLSHFWTC